MVSVLTSKIPWNILYSATLPDVFVDIWQKKLRKCQNHQFFGGKCTTLVTLVETGFQSYQIAALPDMNIFGQILVIFGFFSKKLGGNVPFLSGNSPNYDILAIWAMHVWFIPIALKVFITAALSDISVCNLDTNTNTIQSKKIKLAHTDTIQGIL